MQQFDLAAASVTGRSHREAGGNNQDGWHVLRTPQALVAVVCDGCGSSPHSEVGARLAAPLLAEALVKKGGDPEAAVADLLAHLRLVASAMGEDVRGTVHDYFLFTALCLVVTPETTQVLACGDGLFAMNGRLARLGPFPGNAPPYLGYALMDLPDPPALQVCASLPTSSLETALIGSDGADDLPLDPLWEEERHFRNPDSLRRHLTLLARDQTRPDWERRVLERKPGLLRDDTTLVVLRRRQRG